MQFCVEQSPPWSRNLTTLERVQVAAAGPTDNLGQPIPGQLVHLPADDEVLRLIAAASSLIETYIRRPKMLLQTQYREYFAGIGSPTVMLSVTPVLSVNGITLRDQSMTADWTIDPNTGILFRPLGWEYTGFHTLAIEETRVPAAGRPEFAVDYTAGYMSPAQGLGEPPLPPDIEQACIVTVLQWVQTQTQNLTIQRTRIGDFTQTFFAGSSNVGGVRGLPIPVMDMLAQYRRVD